MILQEVSRIKKEHPDDDSAVMNDRVKGYLKVTRAFGAGFLKQVFIDSKLITCMNDFNKLARYKLIEKMDVRCLLDTNCFHN